MAEVKRLNYFNSQFLKEKDFQDEQAYHIQMRRLNNQRLHTPGIVSGLEIAQVGNTQVSVTAGMAIDKDGREIFLPPDPPPSNFNLSSFTGNAVVYLTIAYGEVFDPVDRNPGSGGDQFVRTTERPKREVQADAPPTDGSVIILAKVTLNNGKVTEDGIDLTARSPLVSSAIGPKAVNTREIADAAITTGKIASAAVTATNIQDGSVLSNHLEDNSVITSKINDGNITTPKLANNSVDNSKIADGAISAANLLAASVGNAALANDAVTANKILNATITAAKIAAGVIPANIGILVSPNLQNGQTIPPPTGFVVTECVFFAFAKLFTLPAGGGSINVFSDTTGKITASASAGGSVAVVGVAIAKKGGW